jgi:hypothetical protein
MPDQPVGFAIGDQVANVTVEPVLIPRACASATEVTPTSMYISETGGGFFSASRLSAGPARRSRRGAGRQRRPSVINENSVAPPRRSNLLQEPRGLDALHQGLISITVCAASIRRRACTPARQRGRDDCQMVNGHVVGNTLQTPAHRWRVAACSWPGDPGNGSSGSGCRLADRSLPTASMFAWGM